MKITLLKDWVHQDTTYKAGEVLELADDEGAQALIKDGTAEQYKEPEPEPAETVTEDDVVKLVDDRLGQLVEKIEGRIVALSQTAKDKKNIRPIVGDVRLRLQDDPQGGFKSLGHFASDIYGAGRDGAGTTKELSHWGQATRELKAAGDGLTLGTGYEGGYLIPATFAASIIEPAHEASIMRSNGATVIPMDTPSMIFRVVDETTHASHSLYGGIIAYFTSEEAQLTDTKPKWGQVELRLHKLTALAYVSNEMLDFSPVALNSWLPSAMSAAIAFKEDDKFIRGHGAAGEPLGIVNAGCTVQTSKETGQNADTITFENIIEMEARLFQSAGDPILWLTNHNCKPQLAKMVIVAGAGGVPVYLPGNSVAGVPHQTLYGNKVIHTEKCASIGDAGDILLCNMRHYYIGDGSGKNRADRNMGLKFDYDQTAFRVVTYVGGTPSWRSALTTLTGGTSHTLSPFVKLEAR